MPISFIRKNRIKAKSDDPDVEKYARLLDVRSPEAFRRAFIPGSYNVPDLACADAARRSGLFHGRQVYLLADDGEQLSLYLEYEIVGWFGSDAIEEWEKSNRQIGSLEVVTSETLSLRVEALNTLVLDIYDLGQARPATYSSALCFGIDDLPLALDGLPVQSSLCITAATTALASFAASLLWNFGFHDLSYLGGGTDSQAL
jgi:hypothetical protein